MSAVIEACEDEATLVDFWIEKSVFRLGSGPDCEFQLDHADIAPHLATVRYRGGKYTLYNRSGVPLSIGGDSIESGESGTWPAGATLSLEPNISLRLVVDGDPAPCPRPDTAMLESYQAKRHEERRLKSVQQQEAADEEAEQKKAARAAKSTGTSGAAIGVLLLGLLLIGMASFLGWLALENMRGKRAGFNPKTVGKNLLAHSADLPPRLVTLLQEAQQSIEMGDRAMGKTRLLRLQAELELLKADGAVLTLPQGDQRVDYEDALRAYINVYLGQLE